MCCFGFSFLYVFHPFFPSCILGNPNFFSLFNCVKSTWSEKANKELSEDKWVYGCAFVLSGAIDHINHKTLLTLSLLPEDWKTKGSTAWPHLKIQLKNACCPGINIITDLRGDGSIHYKGNALFSLPLFSFFFSKSIKPIFFLSLWLRHLYVSQCLLCSVRYPVSGF